MMMKQEVLRYQKEEQHETTGEVQMALTGNWRMWSGTQEQITQWRLYPSS